MNTFSFQAVHSSGAIRSESTLDSSELCGSVSCEIITAVYKKPTHKSFSLITTLPIGALEIEIYEVEISPNLLALKSINNTNIINGVANKNSSPGNYNYFNDNFSYTIEDGLEKITSKGPLQNAFDLMVNILFFFIYNMCRLI